MAKIMLVEDDNNLREIYEARLLAEGYEVLSAKDGEEALALATKERPDLIISDVMMPKISGFDMLDLLRSTPGIEDTKVVMMTALSQAEDKARAEKLGADKYLVKSQVTLEDVARVADELLNPTTTEAAPINQTETQASTENNSEQDSSTTDKAVTPAPSSEQPLTNQTNTASEAPNMQSNQTNGASTANEQPPPVAPTQHNDSVNPQTTTMQSDDTTIDKAFDNTAPTQQQSSNAQQQATNSAPDQPQASSPSNDQQAHQAVNQASVDPPPQTNDTNLNPLESIDTQTTAEEEKAIDKQIDDFVQNQLHSNEPPEDKSDATKNPVPAQAQQAPDSELEGTNDTEAPQLPTQAPTETIAVKSAPEQTDTKKPQQASQNTLSTQDTKAQDSDTETTNDVTPPNQQKGASNQRVINPVNDLSQKPDLQKMAESEERKSQEPLPTASVVSPNGETVTPPNPQDKPDSRGPGNVIQPNNAQDQPVDPNDPANIAL